MDTDGDGVEDHEGLVGNDIAIPHATYKVIGWFDASGAFNARGYVVDQDDRIRHNEAHYLTPIDDIEAATGLDFFPELDATRAQAIESVQHTDLWGSTGSGSSGAVSGGVVVIASLVPNPVGDDRPNEAVTLRNDGTEAVNLRAWRLRDRAENTWSLSGILDVGDERTFLRDYQSMALNNDGDTVELVDGGGAVVHEVTYDSAASGQTLRADSLQ
ncbi:MAG: lamin tail domain-containing protein [Bacteroidota bacterium]